MNVRIRVMTPDDCQQALRLWRLSEGVRLTEVDTPEAIARYLARNQGLSLVAESGGRLVGTILGGHDGRRGYLHHLAVDRACRRRGIGAALVRGCMARLNAAGIAKAHIFVVRTNEEAQGFYASLGWEARDDLVLMSRRMDGDAGGSGGREPRAGSARPWLRLISLLSSLVRRLTTPPAR